MSEELSTGWAHADDMAFWREQVSKFLEERSSIGISSHRSLESKNAELAAEAMYLIANKGYSFYRAAKETGLSEIMIRRTASHYLGQLEKWRPDMVVRLTKISFDLAEVIAMKAEQLKADPDELKKVSIDKLAVAFGIMNDKNLTMQGQATSVIEHRSASNIEEFEAMKAAARDRLAGKSIPVEAQIISENAEVAKA